MLMGLGSSPRLDVFGLVGTVLGKPASFSMSKPSIIAAISLAESIFSAGYGEHFVVKPVISSRIGSFAAALLNAGLFSTWVNLTYGKNEQ